MPGKNRHHKIDQADQHQCACGAREPDSAEEDLKKQEILIVVLTIETEQPPNEQTDLDCDEQDTKDFSQILIAHYFSPGKNPSRDFPFFPHSSLQPTFTVSLHS